MHYLGKGLQSSGTLKARDKHKCCSAVAAPASWMLASVKLLLSPANLLSPPVTTWFSFTGDSFSLGKLWNAIKRINGFWVTTSSSPRGVL